MLNENKLLKNYKQAGIILKRLEDFKFSDRLTTNQINSFNKKVREFEILGHFLYEEGIKPRGKHNGQVRKYRGILNRRRIAMMPRAPTSQSKVNNFQRRVAQLRPSPSSPRRSPNKKRSPNKVTCLGRACHKMRSLIKRKFKPV